MNELKEISRKNPFKVPDNYFEELNRRIISGTSGYAQVSEKKGLYRHLRPYLITAAAIAGFALISYSAFKLFIPARNQSYLSEMLTGQFPEDYINEIDEAALEDNVLSDEEVILDVDIDGNEIIDYLLGEELSFSDIYELL